MRTSLAGLLEEQVAHAIEDQLYAKWTDSKEYNAQVRELLINLRDPQNPDLRQRIVRGEITPEQLSVATSAVRPSP